MHSGCGAPDSAVRDGTETLGDYGNMFSFGNDISPKATKRDLLSRSGRRGSWKCCRVVGWCIGLVRRIEWRYCDL